MMLPKNKEENNKEIKTNELKCNWKTPTLISSISIPIAATSVVYLQGRDVAVLHRDNIFLVNLDNGTFRHSFSIYTEERSPCNLLCGINNSLFINYDFKRSLLHFTKTGRLVSNLAIEPPIYAIAFTSHLIFVSSHKKYFPYIYVFSCTGAPVLSWKISSIAWSITTNNCDILFAAQNHNIEFYSFDGQSVGCWDNNSESMDFIFAVVYDPKSQLCYVASSTINRERIICAFNSIGETVGIVYDRRQNKLKENCLCLTERRELLIYKRDTVEIYQLH